MTDQERAALQQRIAELEREVVHLRAANNELRALNVAGKALADWQKLTAALKTAREALKQIVDRDAWGVPRWNAHVIAQDALQAIDKSGSNG